MWFFLSLTHWSFNSEIYWFSQFCSLLLISNLILLGTENVCCITSVFYNLSNSLPYGLSWNMFHVCLRNLCSVVVGWSFLERSVRSSQFITLFKSSLLIFCLVVLSIIESVGTEISNYYCRIIYLSLHLCQFCYICFDALLLDAYACDLHFPGVAFWWL